jgi:hypothetical protein
MQLRKVMFDRWATDILPLAGEYFRTITKDLMWDKQAVRGHHVGRWLRLGIAIEHIKPGNPQQNGRHERMHLTLKLETTKPAARNFLQQQAKFDDFVDRYNNERAHQALDMQYPAQRASSRQYRGLPISIIHSMITPSPSRPAAVSASTDRRSTSARSSPAVPNCCCSTNPRSALRPG